MTMPHGLAMSELTTAERCEHLLAVIACAMTGKAPHEFMPWVKRGIAEFMGEMSHG